MKEGDRIYSFAPAADPGELSVLVGDVKTEGRRELVRWSDSLGRESEWSELGSGYTLNTPEQAVEWAVGVYGEQCRQSITEQLQRMGEME